MFRDCPVCRAALSDVTVTCPYCNTLLRHADPQVVGELAAAQQEAVGEVPRRKLRQVAKYQRWVILALVLHIFMLCVHLLLAGVLLATQQYRLNPENFFRALIVAESVVAIYTAVVISLLANEILGPAATILYVFLILFPIVSLIALAVLNHKATALLQGYGIRVGFLGVAPETYKQW